MHASSCMCVCVCVCTRACVCVEREREREHDVLTLCLWLWVRAVHRVSCSGAKESLKKNYKLANMPLHMCVCVYVFCFNVRTVSHIPCSWEGNKMTELDWTLNNNRNHLSKSGGSLFSARSKHLFRVDIKNILTVSARQKQQQKNNNCWLSLWVMYPCRIWTPTLFKTSVTE